MDQARDLELAANYARVWLGPDATLTPVDAMNSSTWMVIAAGEQYVLKISGAGEAPALAVATWLAARGIHTGTPIHVEIARDRLVALLAFVRGRELGGEPGDAELVGETLGRVHSLLVNAPVPEGLDRWPWAWLDPAIIDEPDLRRAAARAIAAAEALAPASTHGVLHGDPAPEAFLATDEDVALIDWGSACHGPLLFDVASARMYSGPDVLEPYARTAPIDRVELEGVGVFLAFRWALQACYFAGRIRRDDGAGPEGLAGNEKGLADARRALLGCLCVIGGPAAHCQPSQGETAPG
jgi:homoserine kinase type II